MRRVTVEENISSARRQKERPLKTVMKWMAITILLTAGAAGIASGGLSLSVRFPAFSLSPGEKVSGIKVKSSSGRIITGCRPGRWTCEQKGNIVHCYALHPSYAVALTGLLPEIIIHDLPDERKPTIEATAEFVDSNGRQYTREFREDELIVK